jgi:L-lactate dehydrogenase (cytochrome)
VTPARGKLRRILSLDDFERAARGHLPRPLFHYVHEGVEDGASSDDNRLAFAEFGFVPRTLTDVSQRTARTTLLGHDYAQPFGIAPMGLGALTAYRGDLVMAQGAARANIPMILSGASLIRMEEVIEENPAVWFQVYLPGDPARVAALIDRIATAGFGTLVLTVDTRVSSNRENMVRAGFSTPLRPSPRLAWDGITRPNWLFNTFFRTLLKHGMPCFENTTAQRGAPILSRHVAHEMGPRDHLDWSHLRALRACWKGRLVIKGILAAEDARIAKDCGVDGLILSNHGGRQLDGAVSPLRVLPETRAVVGDLPLMIDSGIRRGTDVLKAIALGADFVFVGRPFNYAAAVAGEAGVLHAAGLLAGELHADMGLLDLNSLSEAIPALLLRLRGVPFQHGMPL